MTRRRSINVEGYSHGPHPIPAACRINRVIMTGGIYGLDVATGQVPDDVAEQARHMFANVARILEAGDSSMDDVIKMTVYVKAAEARAAVNDQWVIAFPEPETRPARQTLQNDYLAANVVMQCDVTAVIDVDAR